MKLSDALTLWQLLSAASVQKMQDGDKLAVLRVVKAVKPVCVEFEDARKDAIGKLKPEGYDERVMKRLPLTDADMAFGRNLETYLGELAGKDVDVSFGPLTQEAFDCLVVSNNYNVGQMLALEELLT